LGAVHGEETDVWKLPRRTGRARVPRRYSFVFLDRVDTAERSHHLADLGRRLRRVRSDLVFYRRQEFLPGKSTRIRAGRLAYTDLLRDACTILDVPHDLDVLRGMELQLEILRVEAALAGAGMDLQTVS
jgi:hypothetical protein